MWAAGTAARGHCGMVIMGIILLSDGSSGRGRRFELGRVEVLVPGRATCVASRYLCPSAAVLFCQPIRPGVGAEAARPSGKPPAHTTPPGTNRLNPPRSHAGIMAQGYRGRLVGPSLLKFQSRHVQSVRGIRALSTDLWPITCHHETIASPCHCKLLRPKTSITSHKV